MSVRRFNGERGFQLYTVDRSDEIEVAVAGSAAGADAESGSNPVHQLQQEANGMHMTRIRQMDEERRMHVAKRRMPANRLEEMFLNLVPYGGTAASGLTLASSSIGAGIISLPYAFHLSGIGMALVYLVVCGLLTVYSHTLLTRAAMKTGLRNYEQVVNELMGPFAAYLLAFFMWLLSFGAEISYTMLVGEALGEFLENGKNTSEYFRTTAGRRSLTAVVWLVCMVPLCLPKEINSLRIASIFAVSFMVFFVICVLSHCGQAIAKYGLKDNLIIFGTGTAAVDAVGIFFFSFINQNNMMEVLREQHRPSVKRMTQSAGLAAALCFVLYLYAGLFGYLDFGNHVSDTSLSLYDPVEHPLFGVAYVGIILKLCVGYGIYMIPVRDATYFVARTDVHKVPYWLNTIVVVTWATLSLIAGMFIPDVTVVFGLIGGLCGGFVGYIFPALLYMYCGGFTLKKVGLFEYVSTYLLLVAGVVGVVCGTVSAIHGINEASG